MSNRTVYTRNSDDRQDLSKAPQRRSKLLIGDTGPSLGRYIPGRDGRKTFVAAETCDIAEGKPRRLHRRRVAWSHPKIAVVCNCYLKDIEWLIMEELNGPCDTDDADLLYDQALHLLVARHIAYNRREEDLNTMEWAHQFLPKFAAEKGAEFFKDSEQHQMHCWSDFSGRPSVPHVDDISRALNLTAEKRARHGLKHLTAIERPPARRKEERREQMRRYAAARRAAEGATPHSESISARQPWRAYGISESTYRRRVAKGLIPADPGMRPVLSYEADDGTLYRVVQGS